MKNLLIIKMEKLSFTLRYVVDYRNRRSTKDVLWSRILAEMNGTDGKVVLACSSLELDSPGFKVEMTNEHSR